VGDLLDVQAAGGHVGGDEGVDLAGLEPRQRLLPRGLPHVAVHGHGPQPAVLQLGRQAVGSSLRADEDQAPAGLVGEQLDQRLDLGPEFTDTKRWEASSTVGVSV